jgi:chemotaxis protein methyltransferase CheR
MTVLPALASRAAGWLDVWSCGCASCEEPYSIAMLWHERLADRFPDVKIRILATDADMHLLVRAGRAEYPASSTKEVPSDIAATALDRVGTAGNEVRVSARHRAVVHRVQSDVRGGAPGRSFHLILCRNLVFTYFDEHLQRSVGDRLVASLHRGGALVLGGHETLPHALPGLTPWPDVPCTYRRPA